MKATAIVYFCLTILTAFIHGNSDTEEEISVLEELLEASDKNKTINAIFKPAESGFLGDGSCGFLYQGELLKPLKRVVAMKFIPPRNKEFAENEYEIYTYLEAINNPDVEQYGIPSVYYYGSYRNYTMMAITLFSNEFNFMFNTFQFDIIDMFVTIQQFVRITKYIHYHGIQHNDIKFDNMMFRRSQGFLIDYNVSKKMYDTNGTTITPAMLRENAKRMAKKDWQQFFFPMCFYAGIMFDLSNFGANPLQDLRIIMAHLNGIEYSGLRRVYVEFAKHAFGGEIENWPPRTPGAASHGGKAKVIQAHTAQKKPFYDQLNDIINEEINRLKVPTPNLVSWVNEEDFENAILDAANTPHISTIKNRFEKTDAKYPEVCFDYFDKLILASSAYDDKYYSAAGPSHSNPTEKDEIINPNETIL